MSTVQNVGSICRFGIIIAYISNVFLVPHCYRFAGLSNIGIVTGVAFY